MVHRVESEARWLFPLCLGAILSFSILSLCFFAIVLSDRGFLAEGDHNPYRNLFEILSFASTAFLVPGVAIWAVIFARRQLRESENVRLALIYIQINNKYNTREIAASRHRLVALHRRYRREQPTGQTLSQYFNLILIEQYNQISRYSESGLSDYSKIMQFLTFLEDIAVLARNGLISYHIIFDFMEGSIKFAEECLKDHIIWRRREANDAHIYANALRLMQQAREHSTSFAFNEGDYRL